MKKIIFSIAALLLTVSASADVVTKTKAESVARNVLGSSSVEYVWNSLDNKNYGDAQPAFHVFNSKDGWVIVAADDCATPVLMHGKGTFDPKTMPDNMRSLLGEIEYNINTARKHKLAQTPEIRKAWVDCSVSTRAAASPVETLVQDKDGNYGTALWNQGTPYNALCPGFNDPSIFNEYGNNGHSYAGCVATAMAIIMRFHQWPDVGVGQIPGYTTKTEGYTIPSIDIDGYEYDLANIPLTDALTDSWYYPGRWSQTQLDKVATLIYHCGAMAQMDYTPEGSGANTGKALSAMIEHMKYSPNAQSLSRSNYTNQQWFNMIKAELDQNHPLLYNGQNKYANSGHAFVCDGYNSNNEIHINWGWGGSRYDGWFAVCYLGEVGGEGTAVYSRSDGAIFGLVPATGTEPAKVTPPGLCVVYAYPGGISLTNGSIGKGNTFDLKISSIWNPNDAGYNGVVRAALLDKSGNIKEFISDEFQLILQAWGYTYNLWYPFEGCQITEDVALGDYISIMYSYGTDEWAPVEPYSSTDVTKLSIIDITTIDLPSTLNVGQICYPGLIFAQKAASSVTWYLDGTALTAEYVKMTTAGDHVFKAVITYSDDSTETIVKKVTVK